MVVREKRPSNSREQWTLITNHGGVLLYVAQYPRTTVVEAATALKLSPRTLLRILADLGAAGYVSIEKAGRQNVYSVRKDIGLRRPEMRGIPVERLLGILAGPVAPGD